MMRWRRYRNLALTSTAAIFAGVVGSSSAIAGDTQQGMQIAQLAQDTSPNPFSALVGNRRQRRDARAQRTSLQKYVLASDDRAFLFETRQNEARIMFLCGADDARLDCRLDPDVASSEIYLAQPTRGPRGDVIYKTTDGRTLLRIASYGGATVYWPGDGRGAAASKSFGDERRLDLAAADFKTVQRRAVSASAFLSALSGTPIIFDVGPASANVSESDHSVLADTVLVTAKGIQLVADDPTGARIIGDRINSVEFRTGLAPTIALDRDILIVTYVPGLDIAGRLSSSAVAQFLENSL